MKPSEQIAQAIDEFVICGGDIDMHSLLNIIEPFTSQLEAENERRGEAIVHACNHARPYVDESGVVCISLHPYGRIKRIALEILDALKENE